LPVWPVISLRGAIAIRRSVSTLALIPSARDESCQRESTMPATTERRRADRNPFDVSHLVAEAAERQVLAGVVVNLDRDQAVCREIVAALSPDMTYGEQTGPLFHVVRDVLNTTADASRADLLAGLRRAGHSPGTYVYALFVDLVSEWAGLESKAATLARDAVAEVRENHARRHAIHAAEVVARSGGQLDDLAGLLRNLERVQAAGNAASGSRPLTLLDAVDAWAKHERAPVIPTGLGWFDGPTEGGLPIGGITALVAKPNVGKSPFALQMTLAALTRDPALRAVWGLGEMTLQQMARRTACVASTMLDGCDPVTMQGAGDRSKAARAANVALCNVIGDRLAIVPAPLTVDRIEERVISTGARLVVIDYLQLIRGGDATDRVQELEHIIGRIRDLAITRECAVVCISSMSSSANTSTRIGSCAKGATEIDYAVELLYVGEADANGHDITWRCMKARNLEKRDLELYFDGASQTFSNRGFSEFSAFAPR
jgi:replicative DNA helicase